MAKADEERQFLSQLQYDLVGIMDKEKDSLRFYYLGNKYKTKIEHFGSKKSYEADGLLTV